MMCQKLNLHALTEMPAGYHVRNCQEKELDIWKAMPFDTQELANQYYNYMTQYFNSVYATKRALFFQKCLFVCDENDKPVGTCFAWSAYEKITTIHWLKILKDYEGKGLGRALLSIVMKNISDNEFPIFLHTQPGSYRAIKLYSDFGFYLLSDSVIGNRKNDLEECLPILKKYMPHQDFKNLRITESPKTFLEAVPSTTLVDHLEF